MATSNISHPRVIEEFEDILPALSDSESRNLEQDILKRGILHPIIVWNGICIDGMHRLRIAKRHKLKYQVKELEFKSKQDAKFWVFKHQAGKRNQNTFSKIVAGLQFADYYKAQAKENQRKSPGRGKKGSTKIIRFDTLDRIAQDVGVARSYVSNVKYITENGPGDIISKCHAGEISIRQAFISIKSRNRGFDKKIVSAPKEKYDNQQDRYEDTIICGDALKNLKDLSDGIATCFIFSPPYNNGTNYSFGVRQDSRPHKKYVEWLGDIILECSRILRDGGRLIINIDSVGIRYDDNKYEEGTNKYTIYPDLINKVRDLDCGLMYKDEICWYKKSHGGRISAWGSYLKPSNPNIRRDHEYIIIWQKGKDRLENITGIPSDLTKNDWNKCIYSTWEIRPETGKSKDHKNCYPEELVRRLLLLYSYPQDLIVDPFNGLGTTTAICAKFNRRWIGIDINPDYCKKAEKRTKRSCRD